MRDSLQHHNSKSFSRKMAGFLPGHCRGTSLFFTVFALFLFSVSFGKLLTPFPAIRQESLSFSSLEVRRNQRRLSNSILSANKESTVGAVPWECCALYRQIPGGDLSVVLRVWYLGLTVHISQSRSLWLNLWLTQSLDSPWDSDLAQVDTAQVQV